MENLGHASASFVDGLTVELLPFQLQSLQFALERERIPRGVATEFVAKVPLPTPSSTELHFNPILGEFSKRKPNIVRGGMICKQMGMGKTIISRALILCNPAPALPLAGSKTTDLANTPKAVNGQAFWNPTTILGKSEKNTKKRASILSQGTLISCPLSLVTQFIAQAKSKLQDPGLLYAYHGLNRSRDPRELVKKSIFVTSYDSLASEYRRVSDADSPSLANSMVACDL
uniref:SNF2 N-terminal domain-containing protein n=1 Tax=Amphora coffeiformis TaxID=265554 RepID=A0A7S3PD68_9STRA